MDKNAIKKYAVWARRELIERVSQRAMFYGVSSHSIGDPDAAEVHGRLLSPVEQKQRQALIRKVREKGFDQIMEEVAYTWFNRFAALRFMEVNGYLPSLVRVFTNEAGEFKPQILSEALHLDLEGLDKQKVLELESGNKSEELFRYLLIVQSNALNSILPGMFQKIEDYTELLLPDNLLRDGSVIEQLVTAIPEEDWTDQVQIIGWLYQYYNTEPKDKVFADLKKNIKISKENIPAATQLFTPDWIVHYMVENSLGRLWLEGHPNDALKSEWKYYLDEAEQEPEVQAQLAEIRKEYAALKPEEIRVIDPCCGSGHILVVMFDVLVQIYEDYGYTAREAASQILENNLWGLDIDERAAQLSYFAVMMKARQYDRRFFSRKVQSHVYAIEESNGITSAPMHDMGLNLSQEEYGKAVKQTLHLIEETHDAKEYGSIINVTPCDWDLLRRFAVPREEEGQLHLDIHGEIEASARLQKLINVSEALAQKYHIVVTNPPYMGVGNMGTKLSSYIKENYPISKSDLFACFIEHGFSMVVSNGFSAMVTMHAWMFLSSLEKLRDAILEERTVTTLLQMDNMVMGIAFGTAATVFRKEHVKGYSGQYTRVNLDDIKDDKPIAFPANSAHARKHEDFLGIPGHSIAYWINDSVAESFSQKKIEDYATTRLGMSTANNDRFMRNWFEVPIAHVEFHASCEDDARESKKRWFPYNKGGSFRKWYGNNDYVVNWENDGIEIRSFKDEKTGRIRSHNYNGEYGFRESLTWSDISSAQNFGIRYSPKGKLFDGRGSSLFTDHSRIFGILGLLTSKLAGYYLAIINQTMVFNVGDVAAIPLNSKVLDNDRVRELVQDCIAISKSEWDSFEYSWDFVEHPFITMRRTMEVCFIKQAFEEWHKISDERFRNLKRNEEELNHILIDIYGLGSELTPEVEDKDVTVRRADLQREVRSFISYAVGCMFGRYSLDISGLIYAGGEWDATKYSKFQPDKDAIIPICDDEYFKDDIVGRFVKFVETVYGKDTLEENLSFIASALGGKGSSREVIRNYFINDFYADHLKVYQKRPIYWLFDSGKKNGFKCLIYMHRYQPDTIARIRTDYVHEQQSRYRTAIADLEHRVAGASPSERVKLTKQLSKIRDQAEELRMYEEKIHHLADQMISIDLDDGVKLNYAKFQDVLAKIK